MKVAELIDKLRAVPQDLRVVLEGVEEGDLWDVEIREAYASVSAGCYHIEIRDERQVVCGRRELVIILQVG
jgi:hypothetical protein